MNKEQTISILHRLHTDKQAAVKFIQDPAAEWKSLGGQLPAGVTSAQFSQRMRKSPIFGKVEATAKGQSSASFTWSPCVTGLVVFLDILGIGSVAAAAALTGPIVIFLGMQVSAVGAVLAGMTQGGVVVIAMALCHGL